MKWQYSLINAIVVASLVSACGSDDDSPSSSSGASFKTYAACMADNDGDTPKNRGATAFIWFPNKVYEQANDAAKKLEYKEVYHTNETTEVNGIYHKPIIKLELKDKALEVAKITNAMDWHKANTANKTELDVEEIGLCAPAKCVAGKVAKTKAATDKVPFTNGYIESCSAPTGGGNNNFDTAKFDTDKFG